MDLEETASLQITQAGVQVTTLPVTAGQAYTFRITNNSGLVHNFHIGPADALAANSVGGLPGVGDFNEGTMEFQYTPSEETASLEFACTIPGHYPAMHGTFTVQP